MAYSLLKSEALKFHLYNFVPGIPTMEHFHQFYCEYWNELKVDISKKNFKSLVKCIYIYTYMYTVYNIKYVIYTTLIKYIMCICHFAI